MWSVYDALEYILLLCTVTGDVMVVDADTSASGCAACVGDRFLRGGGLRQQARRVKDLSICCFCHVQRCSVSQRILEPPICQSGTPHVMFK